jgi:hypothetical protein
MCSGGIPPDAPMRVADWQSKKLGAFAMQLAPDTPAAGQAGDSGTLLCLINRDEIPVPFPASGRYLGAGLRQQRGSRLRASCRREDDAGRGAQRANPQSGMTCRSAPPTAIATLTGR